MQLATYGTAQFKLDSCMCVSRVTREVWCEALELHASARFQTCNMLVMCYFTREQCTHTAHYVLYSTHVVYLLVPRHD